MTPRLILATVRAQGVRLLALARTVYASNPVRGNALIVSAVVAIAARLHVVLPRLSALHLVEVIAPIILAGEHAHRRVSPVRDSGA